MLPKNVIVLDLETQKSFKEVAKGREERLGKLKISVVGTYDYQDGCYHTYEEKELMALEQRLKEVDFVIGFNIRRFDFPVLAPYLFTPTEAIPLLDLLEDVEKFRGHRASLDSLAYPTLNQRKTGSGMEALTLFRENRMEELKQYCLDDVRLTKDLFEFGCEHGHVFFTSTWDYKTYEIPVQWKQTSEAIVRQIPENKTSFPASLF